MLVENVPHAEVRRIYETADLLVDQVLVGWYGGLAVELMALGKPVVAYLRDTGLELIPPELKNDLPVISASPATLKAILRALVQDRPRLRELGYDPVVCREVACAGARRRDNDCCVQICDRRKGGARRHAHATETARKVLRVLCPFRPENVCPGMEQQALRLGAEDSSGRYGGARIHCCSNGMVGRVLAAARRRAPRKPLGYDPDPNVAIAG